MAMSKRSLALAAMRTAGYHEDRSAFTRLLIESRVSMQTAMAAWVEGQRLRSAGVRCDCGECAQSATRSAA